jgi:hypothetical protein
MEKKVLLLGVLIFLVIGVGYGSSFLTCPTVESLNMMCKMCCPMKIDNISVSPNNIILGNSTTISADVKPIVIDGYNGITANTHVWAEIKDINNMTVDTVDLSLTGSSCMHLCGLGGHFSGVYKPTREGNYYVIIHAELVVPTICGVRHICEINKTGGNFSVYLPPTHYPPSSKMCGNISTIGFAIIPGVLDAHKIEKLFSLNYYCAKSILGLWDYNMFLEITYLNGTYVKLNGVNLVYGVPPGRSDSQILYGIGGGTYVSPRFSVGGSSGSGNAIRVNSNTPQVSDATTSVEGNYTKVVYFDRIAVLKTDEGYKLVRVSLGVWA